MRLKLKQQEDINNPNPAAKLEKLQGEIDDIYTQEVQKNLTFLRQKMLWDRREISKILGI